MYTAYVQVFIGQLVTNMLSTHKESKTGSAIPLQARRFRGPFINCVWKVTDYGTTEPRLKEHCAWRWRKTQTLTKECGQLAGAAVTCYYSCCEKRGKLAP